jgi:uncharacterized Zn-binding protein involved in type VI secretion
VNPVAIAMTNPEIHFRPPKSAFTPLTITPYHQWLQPDGKIWADFHFTNGKYLVRFPGMADFEISENGKQIAVMPHASIGEATLKHLLYNQAVPLALSRQGLLVLHGSAVMVGGRAAAFLGSTGMGKSSLAASFATSGYSFLTDDALVITGQGAATSVLPGRPAIRLWQDSINGLLGGSHQLQPVLDYTDKMCILADQSIPHQKYPVPLDAIFALSNEGSDRVISAETRGSDAVLILIRNTLLLDIEEKTALEKHFRQICDLAAFVPVRTLDYPREFANLPGVREHIIANIGRSPQRACCGTPR